MQVAQDRRSQQVFVSSIRGGGQKAGLWVAVQSWYVSGEQGPGGCGDDQWTGERDGGRGTCRIGGEWKDDGVGSYRVTWQWTAKRVSLRSVACGAGGIWDA